MMPWLCTACMPTPEPRPFEVTVRKHSQASDSLQMPHYSARGSGMASTSVELCSAPTPDELELFTLQGVLDPEFGRLNVLRPFPSRRDG